MHRRYTTYEGMPIGSRVYVGIPRISTLDV